MTSYTITELPEQERPRERLERAGKDALTDAELIALVIRAGTEGRNAVNLSKEIVSEFGLENLPDVSVHQLSSISGVGEVKAAQLVAVGEICRRFSSRPDQNPNRRIESFSDAVEHLEEMKHFSEEHLGMICLDSSNRVITRRLRLLKGSTDRLAVDREVVAREAVKAKASGVILAHNHPSGDPEPSDRDILVTEKLSESLESVGIELLDHIVVGEDGFTSLRGEGCVKDS